ncbi:hypothetical protein [Halobacteriovorax sp. HLS]|uniref:hypothetical protein n=1 Tax=Halobacteriovorax sp. HLS TaxID=2234000 RepID=UPI000FD7A78B|nr:hypothetical protein [Halobacteriovorax sp. HLS]
MKKLPALIFVLLLSTSTFALSDSDCREVYNRAFIELVDASIEFNEGYMDKYEFSANVAAISTEVSAVRGVCLAVESPRNKKCVQSYKKRYKALRNEIKLTSVLVGNQTQVRPRLIETISNEFGNLFSRLKCGDL